MIKRYCCKSFVLFRIYARNDQSGSVKMQQYLAYRNCIEATQSIRTQNMSRQTCQKEGGRIVKVKDLKLKRIKDYLEYKFSQRSPALLKLLYFMTSRVVIRVVL
ncbi:hypothetical protein GQ457_02G033840 [Hibiscus cannabinus]